MKKKTFTLVASLIFATILFAQKNERSDNKIVNGKYTILSILNPDQTYGYEIYFNDSLVAKQVSRPFFSLSSGFSSSKNALIVGKWFANELNQGRRNKYSLSLPKAKELGVSDEDLINKIPN